jgi:RNA polymerase sigma-70 factor (ECF subfamily)
MSDFDDRLKRGDPTVCPDIQATFGRVVVAWLRTKYPSLNLHQAQQALERGLANLWNSRTQFQARKTSVSKRLNYFAELAAWALLLKSDFGTVIKHLEKTVYGYIVWMLRGTVSEGDIRETAEDIRQQTFLCAWRSLDRFDPNRSVKAWLWKIARNCLITELQRRKGKRVTLTEDHLETQFAGSEEAAADNQPSAVLRDLCEILEKIPPHHRELLLLSVENGRNYGPEAVQKLRFASPTSVRVTRSRLFKKIREELQRRGHFPSAVRPSVQGNPAEACPHAESDLAFPGLD